MTTLLLVVASLLTPPQSGTSGATGTLTGQVRVAGSATPIPDARVTIFGAGPRETTTADRDGRFTLVSLPPGRYRVIVEREAYAFDLVSPLQVTIGQGRSTSLVLEMQPAGVVIGEVRDERGNPRKGIVVTPVQKIAGGTTAQPGRPQVTNDLGEFRLGSLLPGEYYVLASPPAERQRSEALMPTYYPATTDVRSATVVRIGPGETAAGLAIMMTSVPAFEISGIVVDEKGRPLPRVLVSFVHHAIRTGAPGQESLRASVQALTTRPDGTFRIVGLGPGTYRLSPSPAPSGTPPRLPPDTLNTAVKGNSSTVSVDVRDADISGVTIVMRRTN